MNPSTIAKPGGYSHVVEITGPARIVYIAGQLGLKPNGDIAGDFACAIDKNAHAIKITVLPE